MDSTTQSTLCFIPVQRNILNKIISKEFQGFEILFSMDRELYLHITPIAKKYNKQPRDWLKTKDTKDYISTLSKILNLPKSELMIVRQGGKSDEQGTWIHKKLIILFARWLSPEFAIWCDQQIEDILSGQVTKIGLEESQLDRDLKGLKTAVELLKVNEASKILMMETLYKELGLSTSYLPKYSDEDLTYSLSHLLKKFEVGISAKKLNLTLLEKGYLEIKTRKSTGSFIDEKTKEKKPKMREFKSLTEKGLEFGKNIVSPQNQRETQPHYFERKFKELLELISEE